MGIIYQSSQINSVLTVDNKSSRVNFAKPSPLAVNDDQIQLNHCELLLITHGAKKKVGHLNTAKLGPTFIKVQYLSSINQKTN